MRSTKLSVHIYSGDGLLCWLLFDCFHFNGEPDQLGQRNSRCASIAAMAFHVSCYFAVIKIITIILMKRHSLTRVKLTALYKNHIDIHFNKAP